MGDTVNLVNGEKVYAVPAEQVQEYLNRDIGFRVESPDEQSSRVVKDVREKTYGGAAGKIVAGGAALARGATLGGSDVLGEALGVGEDLQALREVNPYVSLGGEIIGSGMGLGAGASRIGARIAQTAEGASAAARIARAGAGFATEGGLQGLGQGVSELALSDDPLTLERATSVLSSNVLLGGAIGGGAGLLGKAAEIGLTKAKGAIEEIAARGAASQVTGDLAGLDAKALTSAKQAEEEAIKSARVPEQKQFVEDLKGHRASLQDEKVWLATKDADAKAIGSVREAAKISYDADKSIRSMLNNPKNLAENPRRALEALQRQENALEMLAKDEPALRAAFAADASGTRAASLDALPGALERNRGLQAKVREFIAPPNSARLTAIEDAKLALSVPKAPQGIAEKMAGGAAYSMGAGLASAVPFVGPALAPFAGAAFAGMVGDKVFGRLAKGAAEQAGRTSRALDSLMQTAGPIARSAPVIATKVLGAVRYAKASTKEPAPAGAPTLAKVYKARADELRTQTQYTPMGVKMRPEARMAMASTLDPVRTLSPIIADRMETLAARRVEFLASKLPRKPDLQALKTGPDRWQPSDMEMRTFARYAAAVEDPGGIEERLASGQVTPEDAEVMRSVYPERYAHIQQEIVTRLPELQAQLPYAKRLALSIFSGVPVDPSMNPRVMAVLQGSFASEDTAQGDGGAMGPKAKPAFGSVKSQDKTLSEQRQGA